ncbi:MAG: LemA family protein [Nanoarchaeota archaeon]|nr:LemA family protein [Nanoarchaeota archaeon]
MFLGISIGIWTVVGVIAIVLLWFVAAYNGFVRLRNRVEEAWSDIEVQLKRRTDLIPNVIETVKGYAGHEKKVFDDVTEARTRVMGAEQKGDVKQIGAAENMLSGALKTLFAVAENYPDLKANANFLDLQRELADTENKIQAARRFYNTNVRDFNTHVESFPSNIVAGAFHFKKREFFDIDENVEGKPVSVKF